MSRVGKQPIGIPDGVTVNVENGEVTAKRRATSLCGS